MAPTPTSLRAPPLRVFESYILTREVASTTALSNVPVGAFLPCSPGAGAEPITTVTPANSPGAGLQQNVTSSALPIGFDFQIDGITYNKFVVSSNGWMALVDPHSGSFFKEEVMSGSSNYNPGIRPAFTSNAVLLAPWFDSLVTMADSTAELVNFGSGSLPLISTTTAARVNSGLQPPPASMDSSEFAVRYYHDVRSPSGRRLIVRWDVVSLLSSILVGARLKFEVVLYENGRIEFRYANRQGIDADSGFSALVGATIGVFMPNGTNRFRDFSYGLGYRDGERQMYRYGGAVVTSSYADAGGAKYSTQLTTTKNWPGQQDTCAAFIFQPPLNRRKVLPRRQQRVNDSMLTLPTVLRTGDPRLGNTPIGFDDRQTLQFTSGTIGTPSTFRVVNYPTTLPRFYGDTTADVTARQDLFSGDFEITASVVRAATDSFVAGVSSDRMEPFNENKLYENDPESVTDPFFSGSSAFLELMQPVRSKTQIRMAFPVHFNIAMPGLTSSIYYYNKRSMSWNVPQNASYVVSGTTATPTGLGDWANPSVDSPLGRVIEDTKGFGPTGGFVVSGTNARTANPGDQTNPYTGTPFTPSNVSEALSFFYGNSVSVHGGANPTPGGYAATSDEQFTLPITSPMLIEKAVIEVPFAMGDGWFKDKTACFQPLETVTGSFDFGGPGITLALFNQTKDGNNATRRDLILSSTITHSFDNISRIKFSNFSGFDQTYQIRPEGFLSFASISSGSNVVTPVSSSVHGFSYTGSLAARSVVAASNGVSVRVTCLMSSSNINTNRQGVLDLFNTPELKLENGQLTNYAISCSIAYIDNFGRGGQGFLDVSGRAQFGGEFGASQLLNTDGKVPNPFYVSGAQQTYSELLRGNSGSLSSQFANAILNGQAFTAQALIPLTACTPSPYLVFPTDRLVLAAAKTRPFFFGTLTPPPYTSGSIQHDVQFVTGTVYITLYGSQLQQANEYHDTINQPLASNAIHELIAGAEPVLDQFNVEYREVFIDSYTDGYITGSMVTKFTRPDGRIGLITGSCGRAFSQINARNSSVPGTGPGATAANPSKAYRTQPNWQRAGSGRMIQTTDYTERIYDSMMPSLNDCFAADGCSVAGAAPGVLSNPAKVDQRLGWLFFDCLSETIIGYDVNAATNGNWTKAFPFEPRYSGAARQQKLKKSFTFKLSAQVASLAKAAKTEVQSFLFGPAGRSHLSSALGQPTSNNVPVPLWTADANIHGLNAFGFFTTGSASDDDMSRALFGFGDYNNCMLIDNGDTTFTRVGTNNYANHRNVAPDIVAGDPRPFERDFGFSPEIRGWKYGVYSALPSYTNAYFRRDHYGQFRDMLEQRPYTKLFRTFDATLPPGQSSTLTAAVTVRFVDAGGKLTAPENTWSQNLSFEATSSMPYFDGETRDRPDINTNTLNTNIITLTPDAFGQVSL